MVQLKKLRIKGIEVPSRFFFAPINTGLAQSGNPSDDLITFHALRSNPYTGINFVGNVAINKDTVTNNGTLFINSTMQRYAELAKSIHANGSLPGVQIACLRSSFSPMLKWKNLRPNNFVELIRREIGTLSTLEIKQIVREFQIAIKTLFECGFRVMQIHGAHGYLLNTFLSKTFNLRNDEYGRDRGLIVREILDGLDRECRESIFDLRVSVFETSIENILTDEAQNFLDLVYGIENIDIISVSNGIYNIDKKLIYPNWNYGNNFMLPILKEYVRSHTNKLWNISGNISNLYELEESDDELTFSIGRPIIADENFVSKWFSGQEGKIRMCERTNKCHFFSRNKEYISCGVNPKLF